VIGALFIVGSIAFFIVASNSLLFSLLYIVGVIVLLAGLVKFALWKIQRGKPEDSIYSGADQEGYVASTWDRTLVGKDGIVATDLRPGGHIIIDNKPYPAISQSGYIIKGTRVTVIGGEGDALIVKQQMKGNGS
jgi:membrane-bound serine protease (ClpP class)